MRFQVPQNLDVPDTIFLGLDFRQLVYLGGALGFSVFLFLFTTVPITLLFGIPAFVLAGLLSFFSYNNQKFVTLFQALIHFFSRKKMYLWRQSGSDVAVQYTAEQNDFVDGELAHLQSYSQQQEIGRVREMSSNLVFSDEEDDTYDDIDIAL